MLFGGEIDITSVEKGICKQGSISSQGCFHSQDHETFRKYMNPFFFLVIDKKRRTYWDH